MNPNRQSLTDSLLVALDFAAVFPVVNGKRTAASQELLGSSFVKNKGKPTELYAMINPVNQHEESPL